jgi:hypothetical protein
MLTLDTDGSGGLPWTVEWWRLVDRLGARFGLRQLPSHDGAIIAGAISSCTDISISFIHVDIEDQIYVRLRLLPLRVSSQDAALSVTRGVWRVSELSLTSASDLLWDLFLAEIVFICMLWVLCLWVYAKVSSERTATDAWEETWVVIRPRKSPQTPKIINHRI